MSKRRPPAWAFALVAELDGIIQNNEGWLNYCKAAELIAKRTKRRVKK